MPKTPLFNLVVILRNNSDPWIWDRLYRKQTARNPTESFAKHRTNTHEIFCVACCAPLLHNYTTASSSSEPIMMPIYRSFQVGRLWWRCEPHVQKVEVVLDPGAWTLVGAEPTRIGAVPQKVVLESFWSKKDQEEIFPNPNTVSVTPIATTPLRRAKHSTRSTSITRWRLFELKLSGMSQGHRYDGRHR